MNRRLAAVAATGLTALALAGCSQPRFTAGPIDLQKPITAYDDWLTCVRTVEPTDQNLYECDRAYAGAGGTGTPTVDGVVAD